MGFIRRLGLGDRALVKAHYARLGSGDRYLRFGHGLSDHAVDAYVEGIDWFRTIVLGYVDGGVLRGVVEIVPAGPGPWALGSGELALTVERPWRNQGVGTELCRCALVLACNRHLRDIVMVCLTENVPMRRLAARLNAVVHHHAGDMESRLLLPAPTPWSFVGESLISSAAAAGYLLDVVAAPTRTMRGGPARHAEAAGRS